MRILDRGKGGKVGIVTVATSGRKADCGRVYACTWSPDTALTESEVARAFSNSRRDFKPFDESSGHYVGGGRS